MGHRSGGRVALALAVVYALAAWPRAATAADAVVIGHGMAEWIAAQAITLTEPGDAAVRVGGRATLDADRLAIVHHGSARASRRPYGLIALDGADVRLADGAIDMRGVRAIGAQAQRDALVLLERTRIAVGPGGAALALAAGGRAQVRGGRLDAPEGHAVDTRFRASGMATLELDGTDVRGRLETGETGLRLHALGGSIVGDMTRGGSGRFDAELDGTHWRGVASGVDRLSLARATWSPTGDSDVATLALGDGGHVAFQHDDAAFHALRAHAWDAAGAPSVTLATRLDAGGPLARQATDRLLIHGDASGGTWVHVVNAGGAGAATGAHGDNGPSDGISVVQVGGRASHDAFRLVGDYVVAGPWRYALVPYAPGEADARQRLLDGEGGFWDYRLQSTRVHAPGRGAGTRPALAPQVPAYLVLGHALLAMGQSTVEALHGERPDDTRDATWRVHAFGGDTSYRSTLAFADYGVDYRRDIRGVQMVVDMATRDIPGGMVSLGGALTAAHASVLPRTDDAAHARIDSRGGALYLRLDGDDGWHGMLSAGADAYRTRVAVAPRGERTDGRAHARHLAASAGYAMRVGAHLRLEPGIAVTHQRVETRRRMDRDGVAAGRTTPTRTGATTHVTIALPFEPGGRVVYAWMPYVDLGYAAARDHGRAVTLGGERFATGAAGRGAVASVGATVALGAGATLSLETTRRWHVRGQGDGGRLAHASFAMAF